MLPRARRRSGRLRQRRLLRRGRAASTDAPPRPALAPGEGRPRAVLDAPMVLSLRREPAPQGEDPGRPRAGAARPPWGPSRPAVAARGSRPGSTKKATASAPGGTAAVAIGSMSEAMVEAMGALSNPHNLTTLDQIDALILKILAKPRARFPRPSVHPPRRTPLLRTVEQVLSDSERAMHIAAIHEALEDRLRTRISRASLKDCLSDHSKGDHPRFRRQRRGWYRLR